VPLHPFDVEAVTRRAEQRVYLGLAITACDGVCDQAYLGVVTVRPAFHRQLTPCRPPPSPMRIARSSRPRPRSPLPPTGCNTFVNTGELIRSTDDSLKQCQVQQNGGTH
jgi:hypothetical protein